MIRHRRLLVIVLATLCLGSGAGAVAKSSGAVPRTILALYDSRDENYLRFCRLHQIAEMPLNQLGLKVTYWDINQGMPALSEYENLRGIITWLLSTDLPDPEGFLAWEQAAVDQGLRLVILGDFGNYGDPQGHMVSAASVNRLLERLGLRYAGRDIEVTYQCRVTSLDPRVVGFERPLPPVLPPFPWLEIIDRDVQSHLTVDIDGNPAKPSHLVVTGPHGGLAASAAVIYMDVEKERRQWILNPFEFFREAFATDELPKPDTTTLCGRRIYYSHIDGDGWFNATEIHGYAERQAISADVIRKEILEGYPDWPFTVGPVTTEFDSDHHGDAATLEGLRKIFALPNVEAGSHTHTHPFEWGFFEHYTPEKEIPFHTPMASSSPLDWLMDRKKPGSTSDGYAHEHELDFNYERPRAYLEKPFDLNQEIGGSAAALQPFLPPGKKVMLLQWSGNCWPFPEAIRLSREAGLRNLNGGDPRFDPEVPSYGHVKPIGVEIGGEVQIYASACNEVVYTQTWTRRFYGLKLMDNYLRHTETPRRVKPFNLYFHMFSGQKQASLNALKQMLQLAQDSQLAPVPTSQYAAIGDGFFSTQIIALGQRRWRVEDRDQLQTIRFDHATLTGVDFAHSQGVIGQRHFQGSLYVALDPAVSAPVVALQDIPAQGREPAAERPYLVESRWQFRDVQITSGTTVDCQAQGYGAGEMTWLMPRTGQYRLVAHDPTGREVFKGASQTDAQGALTFRVEADGLQPLQLQITWVAPAGGES